MKHRFEIGYLSVVALMALGFESCLIDELWVKIIVIVIDILAFVFDMGQKVEKKNDEPVDGMLHLMPGEDKTQMAVGLSIDTNPDTLLTKKTATFEVVNHMGGADDGNGQANAFR